MTLSVAIVGSAGDIGQDLCNRFLARGARVLGLDIGDQSEYQKGLDASLSDRFVPIHVDITDSKSVDNAFESAGDLDVLVNNAGGISAHSLQTTTEETWNRDLELNLTGVWRCIHAVLPRMVELKTGVIVNTVSVNGLGIFGHPGYSVAKAGLIHLTKFAAVEYGKHGIRVLAVAPGTVRTRAWQRRMAGNPDILDEALNWYPSRAISESDDVAKMIEFAALDAPKTMNGSILTLDGGLTSGQDRVASAFCGGDI